MDQVEVEIIELQAFERLGESPLRALVPGILHPEFRRDEKFLAGYAAPPDRPAHGPLIEIGRSGVDRTVTRRNRIAYTVRRPSLRPDRHRNPEPAFRRRCSKFYAPFFLLLLISNPFSDRRNHLSFSRFIGFGSVLHCKSRAIPAACHYPNYGSSYHYYRFGREGAAGMEKSINFVTDNNNRSIWTRS